MAKLKSINVHVEPELDDRLEAVAASLDRPRSWVVEQALREFLDLQAWQLSAIDAGVRDADAGRVARHEDVAAWVASWDKPDEKPMPECE